MFSKTIATLAFGGAGMLACASRVAHADTPPPARPHAEHIVVTAVLRGSAVLRPQGQTTVSADRSTFANRAAQSVADMVATLPGVTTLQGNGPRDTVVSIRGSGARQSYGLRNLQVLEDGFPVTQPDGTARADLIDPHAYDGIDVFQGPASTLYGNYAINGAINFRTRDGADIHGLELGSDFGSFGTFNNYATLGAAGQTYDFMLFASDVRGRGFIANSNYATSTENMKLRIKLSSRDRIVLKFVNNVTDTMLPLRLSVDQFRANPYQDGCLNAASAAPGCASVNLLVNGRYGARAATSAQAAGLGRFDRRTITGLRWEHDIDDTTTWRTQFTYDQRHIHQPTSTTDFSGPFNSYNAQTDISHSTHSLESYLAASFDYLDYGYQVYNLTPQGGATRGGVNATSYGHQWNAGARAQADWRVARAWHVVVGLGGTYTDVGAVQNAFTLTPAATTRTVVTANRHFFNLAPEASVIYAPRDTWSVHARLGTAYATPGYSSFFVTPLGTYGNNTRLESETSLGFDLGGAWHPTPEIDLQAIGFYEFYRNEFVSQSAGVNAPAGNYTFNAPASQHRGVELSAAWQPLSRTLPGLHTSLSYTYDNQIYTDYVEQLSNSAISQSFSRKGKLIPGVMPHYLNARLLYDQPSGLLQGAGGSLELVYRSGFWIDNANLLKIPDATVLNLEFHYDPPVRLGWAHRLHSYVQISNLTNRIYAAGASNVADGLASNGQEVGANVLATRTGSIYAAQPRAVFGGVRIRF